MTNRDFYVKVIELVQDAEVVAKAEEELAKMDARNEKRKAMPSKKAIENAPIITEIENYLKGQNEVVTARQIADALELTTSKVSALIKKIDDVKVSEVVVDRRVVKGYAL